MGGSAKNFIVFLLTFCLMYVQVVPVLADAKDQKYRVAFVGLKFKSLPQDIQDVITWRMNAIVESETALLVTKPYAAKIAYGQEKMTELLEKQDKESYEAFAKKFNFDYVFGGELVNASTDGDIITLVGSLVRYDHVKGVLNRHNIHQVYDKFGNDLVRFQEQYVHSLIVSERKKFSPWPILLVGGGVVVGIIAFSTTGNKGPGAGDIPVGDSK